jgi:hypothetical protein
LRRLLPVIAQCTKNLAQASLPEKLEIYFSRRSRE